ncbi:MULTISPECIES: 50S ribosomal protein L17 [Thermodesulfovibrio]|jgi:large subunit ribosomal protein L17|uniref:Large ribosomal subunit protein bL17 n=2 Tax=Thermodesulfovibrio yellowstonii TaxID=28262 RepID=RL17_THEYD|nr:MULTISPECIES: 50S ribosomal protein L17 [Thermodesulfovibrio]B5YG21.1 RecName: Full=Large ribosomal subunit protein bL17; AltName: Full=50S ribosomal protein L17 [Thermodesulfovibrio yellowstonii DSM 11347]ACI20294.1 ribosomal protein L17 [Thermodesulfovibrio yellowstonii DSM 11347]MDI6865949.1 50S ribosomal protein L17 [Thermodesulfovibrio yellowstonii]GLI53190.1 50S ribosomal protein L17 [Thermodesulfovibrio islandicus]
MRHRVSGRHFGRTANQRKALLRGLLASLIKYERIETTVAKAKAVKELADRLVTFGKKGDLHSRRIALSYLPDRELVKKLFNEIAPRFSDRNGGYVRVIKTGFRIKDSAPKAILEFVDYAKPEKESDKEEKKAN